MLTSYVKKLRTVLLLYNITDARAANIQAFSIISDHTQSVNSNNLGRTQRQMGTKWQTAELLMLNRANNVLHILTA